MIDSWMPMKLEAHIENMYSMPSDLKMSTMKSDACLPFSAALTSAAAGAAGRASCGAATAGWATNAAAPAAAPFRKLRRLTGPFCDFFIRISLPGHCIPNLQAYATFLKSLSCADYQLDLLQKYI